MPTAAELRQFRAAQQSLVDAARRELSGFIAMLPDDPAQRRKELMDFLPRLVDAYGDAGVAAAYDFLESTSPRKLNIVVPTESLEDAVKGNVGWATRDPEFDLRKIDSLLHGPLQRQIQAPWRRMVAETAEKNGARYARVPSGTDTCAFCLMVASRGAVYYSRKSAGDVGNKYHDDCWCVPALVFEGGDLPEGYNPQALYAQYMAARDMADNHFATAEILKYMREMGGLR